MLLILVYERFIQMNQMVKIIISIVAANPGADYTFIPVSDIVTMTNYYPLFFCFMFRVKHKNRKNQSCM